MGSSVCLSVWLIDQVDKNNGARSKGLVVEWALMCKSRLGLLIM